MVFAAGQRPTAAALNDLIRQAVDDTQVTGGTTTSTTFTATLSAGTTAGKAFVAPLSGKVNIHYECQQSNSGANFNFCSPHVRTGSTVGSGADVLAPSDDDGVLSTGTNAARYAAFKPLSGLTPGASYNVKLEVRVSGGTGTFSRFVVSIVPA